MKKIIPLITAAAIATSGSAFAQTPAYSKPSGYVTQQLKTGFNLVGLTLHNAPSFSGSIEVVGTSSVTDNELNFTPAPNSLYVMEFTSGAALGKIQEVPTASINGTVISLVQPTATIGITVGDTYVIRKAPTLEELFGTTTTVLQRGATATAADIIWVPNGVGGYDRYFLNTLNVWRNVAGGTAPNIPIVYIDAIFVQRKGADTDWVLTGQVKTSGCITSVITGFNLLGTSFPAGSTLQNLGLQSGLTAGATATAADIVWVPDGSGGFTRFFYNTLGAWRNVAGGAATADFPITSAIFVQKKGTPTNITFTAPSTYTGL